MKLEQDLGEGEHFVSFPELAGCITCADTLAKVINLASDAKREWIAAALESGIRVPLPKEA